MSVRRCEVRSWSWCPALPKGITRSHEVEQSRRVSLTLEAPTLHIPTFPATATTVSGSYQSLATMASRPHVFTREQLTSMKRVDIQRICKDYGVRANMKTDALIDVRALRRCLFFRLSDYQRFSCFLIRSSMCFIV